MNICRAIFFCGTVYSFLWSHIAYNHLFGRGLQAAVANIAQTSDLRDDAKTNSSICFAHCNFFFTWIEMNRPEIIKSISLEYPLDRKHHHFYLIWKRCEMIIKMEHLEKGNQPSLPTNDFLRLLSTAPAQVWRPATKDLAGGVAP